MSNIFAGPNNVPGKLIRNWFPLSVRRQMQSTQILRSNKGTWPYVYSSQVFRWTLRPNTNMKHRKANCRPNRTTSPPPHSFTILQSNTNCEIENIWSDVKFSMANIFPTFDIASGRSSYDSTVWRSVYVRKVVLYAGKPAWNLITIEEAGATRRGIHSTSMLDVLDEFARSFRIYEFKGQDIYWLWQTPVKRTIICIKIGTVWVNMKPGCMHYA